MKILVTGGAGFIGSHLVDKLIQKEYEVIVVDNLSSGKKANLDPIFLKKGGKFAKAKFYKIDICDHRTSRIFEKEGPEVVFHYAAQINVRKSIEDPVKDAEINILGTINILENCKKYRIKKFIFASSVGVYGEPKSLPLKENNFLNPISPHAISKWAIEEHLKFYKNHGLDFVSLRYSNVYGPRQSYKNGGVTAIFISKILKGENPIVYNSGEQTRDFLYVDDAVEAAILTLKARSGSIYNVGTNQEIKIKDLLKLIAFKLQKKVKPTFKAVYQGEIIKSRIDFSEIKKEFGWKPKYNLDEGLNKTIKWFTRQNFLTNED